MRTVQTITVAVAVVTELTLAIPVAAAEKDNATKLSECLKIMKKQEAAIVQRFTASRVKPKKYANAVAAKPLLERTKAAYADSDGSACMRRVRKTGICLADGDC